ncbi:MAG: TIGR00266 family protein [Myxococcota bacterium]|nr:TIGR00266 family protein [Myxococcota bacterium]
MQIELESRPSFGMAVVTLQSGEEITAESGAMVAMSPQVSVDTTFNGTGSGGLMDFLQAAFVGLVRKFLAGETMFVNTFKATGADQQVMLAPAMSGDVVSISLDGQREITVQAGSYLASTKGIKEDLIWGGFSMLFSGEGAFFLKCSGSGELIINSYGAIEKVEVDGSYRVDTGHVVAFEGDLRYAIKKAGGWTASVLSGEGLVLEFTGKGTVWLQTRNLSALVGWISPHLPS